jgi:hypothetical protein
MKPLLLLALISLPATATSIVSVSASIYGQQCSQSDAASASCTLHGSDAYGNLLYAFAIGTSRFGFYEVGIQGLYDPNIPTVGYSASAHVSVNDTLTISGPVGSGYLRLDGLHYGYGSYGSFYPVQMSISVNWTSSAIPYTPTNIDFPITFGQPLPFLLDLRVSGSQPWRAGARVEFASFSVLDANKNLILSYGYGSSAGPVTQYVPANGSAPITLELASDVPEPGTISLAAVALLLVLIGRRALAQASHVHPICEPNPS